MVFTFFVFKSGNFLFKICPYDFYIFIINYPVFYHPLVAVKRELKLSITVNSIAW